MSAPTVVVTGAAGGIGLAIVERLHADGWQVIGVDLSADVVRRMSDVGADVAGVRADLTTGAGIDAVLAAVPATLDGLVNCAGITRDGLLSKLSDDDVALVMEVNAVAGATLTEALEPRFAAGASVVNIASRAALGNVGQVNYAASKGALIGLTRALARRLAPQVRVNAVAPGLIATEMTAAMPDHVLDKLVGRVPVGRMGTPAEAASAVAALLSPSAGYVTGQVVYICGGRSI